MKIALLGNFGSGNYGNDGSLEAMTRLLRRIDDSLDLLCICSDPASVRERLGLEAISISSAPTTSRIFAAFDRAAFRLPGRLRTLAAAHRGCKGVDAVIVPGTGILDDFQDGAFGWPYVLLRWCIAARLRGARVAFVSIGAGPVMGGLSRRFITLSAGLASYRSYRDEGSRTFMRSVGIDVSSDPVFPDIAFGLPADEESHSGAPTVCVGLMTYSGWAKNGPDGQVIFNTYIDKIATVVEKLLAEGLRVRLIGGDASDSRALERTLQRVDPCGARRARNLVTVPAHRSLADVKRVMAECDTVIASRYHNVICAIAMARPTISIGYAAKNDAVLDTAGLSAYGHHIESFDPDEIMADFRRLCAERRSLTLSIRKFLDHTTGRLAEQEADLRRFIAEVAAGALKPAGMKCGWGRATDACGDPHAPRNRLKIAARPDAARTRASGRANK